MILVKIQERSTPLLGIFDLTESIAWFSLKKRARKRQWLWWSTFQLKPKQYSQSFIDNLFLDPTQNREFVPPLPTTLQKLEVLSRDTA